MIKRSSFRTRIGVLLACSALAMVSFGVPARADQTAQPRTQNPISQSFADTFADPSIIQAKDGWWYAYSTADPLRSGDEPGIVHIARTKDFLTWDYQGTVFNQTNRPSWATATSGLWAPDIRYIDGQYVLYFTVTDTTLNPGDDSAIGVATAPNPTGPWTPTDEPVVAPRAGNGGYLWTFDPAGFTDIDGSRYLYFGSYNGGLWATRMTADGITAVGDYTQVAIDNRYEGGYVVRHGDWYYLMASSANCCAGPATGYSVFAGRSTSPLGPFVDADGISLLASRVGGTLMVTQNGNRWIGAGHHAIATDASGRDFIVYHALDRTKPWLDEPFGINRRPMLLDRIDWINGWPRTRAGAGPSDTAQPAPVTGSGLGIIADNPAAQGFQNLKQGPADPQAGNTAVVGGSAVTTKDAPAKALRVRLDLQGDQMLLLSFGEGNKRALVIVDPKRGKLSVTTRVGRNTRTSVSALAIDGDSWRALVVEFDEADVLAQVSESDLGDPGAEVRHRHQGFALAAAPARLTSLDTLVDNITIRPLAVEATTSVGVPEAGRLISADEFSKETGSGWTWVRRDADAKVSGGSLNWPLQSADLVGSSNNAGVLLRDTPSGTWIAETKLTVDLGENDVRNFQQAGLIAYDSDDNFARLSSVSIWNTRQTEFGRELVATAQGQTAFGGAIIGTPSPTVWLRLAHHRNAQGEHLYRAATSRNGKDWTWGAVWTFDADAKPRIGLVAHGGANPTNTAKFDYLRFYASSWPKEWGGR